MHWGAGTILGNCQSMIDVEAMADVKQRLAKREMLQNDLKNHDDVHSLLGMIQAIRYAKDWSRLDRESKRWYREDMLPNRGLLSKKELNKAKKVFESRHEKIVKARRDLGKLFEQVSTTEHELTSNSLESQCLWTASGTQSLTM